MSLFAAASAHAESGGAVVLALQPAAAPVEVRQRTEDELVAAGFDVVEGVASDAKSDEARWLDLAAQRAALAVIVLQAPTASDPEWTILVLDRVTGKRSERRFAGGPQPSADRIALLAVELLYASLLELEAARSVPSAVDAPPAVTRELRRRLREPSAQPRWLVRAGAGVFGSPGGIGVLPTGSLGVGVWSSPGWGFELDASPSLVEAELYASGSSAGLWLGYGTARAMVSLLRDRPIGLATGLGGGVLVARSDGHGRAPLEGTTEWTAIGLLSATAALGWRVTPRLRLRGALEAGLTLPELRIRFAGEEIAAAGRPLFAGSAGIEWTWGVR